MTLHFRYSSEATGPQQIRQDPFLVHRRSLDGGGYQWTIGCSAVPAKKVGLNFKLLPRFWRRALRVYLYGSIGVSVSMASKVRVSRTSFDWTGHVMEAFTIDACR